MFADVWGNSLQVFLAVLVLILLCAPPGIGLLRLSGVGVARPFRLTCGTILGMVIIPLFYNVIGMAIDRPLGLAAKLLIWIVMTAGLWLAPNTTKYPKHHVPILIWAMGILAGALTLMPLLQHNTPLHNGLIRRVSMFDWAKHLTIASAFLLDDHLPPLNPYLSLEPDLHYYYFAYMTPALATQLSGGWLFLANCLFAQATLLAFAFPLFVYHYARDLKLTRGGSIVSAGMATFIGGWDIVYVWQMRLTTAAWPSGFAGSWTDHSDRSIRQMAELFLWTPQHVLGVLIAIFIFWSISRLARGYCSSGICCVALALLIAGLAGTSAFVWFVTFIGLLVFILVELLNAFSKRSFRLYIWHIVLACSSGLLLVAPYLYMLSGRDEPAFIFQVSRTRPGLLYGGVLSQVFGESRLAYALDFPLQMLPEFGLVLFTGFAGWRVLCRQWRDSPEWRLWTVYLPILFFVILAIRPGRIYSNEYAAYSAPIAWVILALLSGMWWMQRQMSYLWRPLGKVFVIVGAFLGFCGAFYEPFIQLSAPYMVISEDYALYQWLNDHLEQDDVYQINDHRGEEPQYFVQRASAFLDPFTSPIYVGSDVSTAIARTAVDIGKWSSYPYEAWRSYQRVGVTVVVSRVTTPLASEAHSLFGAYFQLIFENRHYRVYELRPENAVLIN